MTLLLLNSSEIFSQYGFGTNQPNENSMVHIVSEDSTKGFIIPMLKPGAVAPDPSLKGMIAYDPVDSCVKLCTGVAWVCIVDQNDTILTDNQDLSVGVGNANTSIIQISNGNNVILSEGNNIELTESGDTITFGVLDSGWLTSGNTGTNSTTDFLGTTDNQSLAIRTNNVTKLRLTTQGTLEFLNSGESIFIGEGAGAADDLSANGNIYLGYETGNSSTSAEYNTIVGYRALYTNTVGSYNTALGSGALFSNVDGNENIAVGGLSLSQNTGGGQNVAIGVAALEITNGDIDVGTASFNTALGFASMELNTTGSYNAALGHEALQNNTVGEHNTAIGFESMNGNTDGGLNTALGAFAFPTGTSFDNSTALGALSNINASNKVRIGNASVTTIEGQVAYSFPSDGRFKSNISDSEVVGLDFILKLRPVTYNFDTKKFDEFLMSDVKDSLKQAIMSQLNYEPSRNIKHSGFIAQEVESAMKDVGYDFDGVHLPNSEKDNYSVSYSQFVVPMVKAIQEQQELIKKNQKENEELRSVIRKMNNDVKKTIEEEVSRLEKMIEEQRKIIEEQRKQLRESKR